MSKMFFVSLPVADVAQSTAFYEAIGFTKDQTFSQGAEGAMVRWSEEVSFMLLSYKQYAQIAPKPMGDSHATCPVAFALSFDSREAVDAIVAKAVAAGGKEGHGPEDLGFMYSRAFEDPDGFAFGPMWMDVAAAVAATSKPQFDPA